MNVLLAVVLLLAAAGGTLVVLEREPLHQSLVLGVYGILLAVLFVCVGAPDVALSQLVVGAILLPALIVFAIVKTRDPAGKQQ